METFRVKLVYQIDLQMEITNKTKLFKSAIDLDNI